jgi:hypothetical protein
MFVHSGCPERRQEPPSADRGVSEISDQELTNLARNRSCFITLARSWPVERSAPRKVVALGCICPVAGFVSTHLFDQPPSKRVRMGEPRWYTFSYRYHDALLSLFSAEGGGSPAEDFWGHFVRLQSPMTTLPLTDTP